MDTVKKNASTGLPIASTQHTSGAAQADEPIAATQAHEPDEIAPAALPLPQPRPGIWAINVLAIIALIFTLQWAREFFIPLVFGILIAYTLNPVVMWLERMRLPRVVATVLVMLALFGSTGLVATSVYNEAQAIVDELPIVTYKFTSAMKRMDNGELGTLDKLRSAADALKKVALPQEEPAAPGAKTDKAPPPAPKLPEFDLNTLLWAGGLSVAAFVGQMTMVLFLVFFALLSGNTFKRKLVRITGPSLSDKKITVQILDDINQSIQKYMLMLLVTNILLGTLTWVMLHSVGLDNPAAWAVVAALLHIIPYFGSLIAAITIGFAAFLQFESFSMMLLLAAATLAIATFVGIVIATWMTGRIAKMNATAVFVALLFGAWLWGVWGMLLCVPIIVVVKVISQHVEGLQSVAELLGE